MVRVKEPMPDARHDWRVESRANHLVVPLKWSIETCLGRSVAQLADIRHTDVATTNYDCTVHTKMSV